MLKPLFLGFSLIMAAPTLPAAAQSAALMDAVEVNNAVNVVERLHLALTNLMLSDETQLSARKALIQDDLTSAFDLTAMTRAIVGGRTWRGLDEAKQRAAIDAFSDWMITQYASRFTQSSAPEFTTRSTRDGGLNTIVVETELTTKKRNVGLDYRLRKSGNAVRIIDVFLDGRVSEVSLRKSEFTKTLREDGIDGFIAALKSKTRAAG